MKILIWVGSLRAAAFTRKVAEAAANTGVEGLEFEFTDGRDLPLYDQDLDGDDKPPGVQTLLAQVTAAKAMLFVTPEFNYGIPGPLKNAIDWASRPAYRSPLKNKPSTIISLSVAPTAGARAHSQLSMVLSGTLTPQLVAPGFSIPAIHEKFDDDGALNDDMTKMRLARLLEEL